MSNDLTFDCFSFQASQTCKDAFTATPFVLASDTATDDELVNKAREFVNEVVSVVLYVLPVAFQLFIPNDVTNADGSEKAGYNTKKGAEALYCAMTSGFTSVWKLLASLTLVAKEFKQSSVIQEQVAEYYPLLCTCRNDVNNISRWMTNGNGGTLDVSCQ